MKNKETRHVSGLRSWLFAVTLAALALLPTHSRCEDKLPLIVPPGSPVHLLVLNYYQATEAKFSGRMWISGIFVAEWDTDVEPGTEITAKFWIVPDAASVAKLPHFARYEVAKIEVEDGSHTLPLVFGRDTATSFTAKKLRQLKAKGRFQIDRYYVAVECDAPWATARVIAIDPQHFALTKKKVNVEGC